jgi:hypothetical protein
MQQSQPHRGNKSPTKAKSRNGLLSGWWRSLRAKSANTSRSHVDSTLPTPNRTIAQIEATIWENRRRIERIHQQNAVLSQQLAQIEARQQLAPNPDRSQLNTAAARSPHRKSRAKSNRNSWIQTWLWIVCAVIFTAIVCGVIGFALTRSISML